MSHDDAAREDSAVAHAAVRSWSDRKSSLFTPPHVERAWQSLRDRGLVAAR
ncbi:hypothetical protein [Kribbella qitaiheensis]|uniref:hypothetical protein n=1 Tax=Kribbella qitaiheensis TaxID=1544730 RepID=UPI001623C32D|nr:hypothetical protein [Kribbella qitaiheensis]